MDYSQCIEYVITIGSVKASFWLVIIFFHFFSCSSQRQLPQCCVTNNFVTSEAYNSKFTIFFTRVAVQLGCGFID